MTVIIFEPPIAAENNPFADANFFDLNFDASQPDDVELSPGLLNAYPGGLRALDGNDTVVGSSDGETMNGNAGDDLLSGRNGADYLRGGQGNDEVYGGDGDDILNGNKGIDIVIGGLGNDLVRGGQDNDLLIGGFGNDTLVGDFGQDILTGGGDADTFILRTDAAQTDSVLVDIIVDFDSVSDRLGLTGGLTAADLTFTQQQQNLDDLREISDFISLLDGLNITFEEFRDAFVSGGVNRENIIAILDIGGISTDLVDAILETNVTPTSLDPNQDGIIEGTLIGINGSDRLLGFVLNATEAELTNAFVSIDDSLLAIG